MPTTRRSATAGAGTSDAGGPSAAAAPARFHFHKYVTNIIREKQPLDPLYAVAHQLLIDRFETYSELLDVEFDLPPDFWEDYEVCEEWLDACEEVCAPSPLSHAPTALLRGRLLWAV